MLIKLGMLANEAIILRAVAASLPAGIPIVLDPVMVATPGAVLLEEGAIDAMRRLLLPRATLVTPNLPETAKLTGLPVGTVAERIEAWVGLAGHGRAGRAGEGRAWLRMTFSPTIWSRAETGGRHLPAPAAEPAAPMAPAAPWPPPSPPAWPRA